jgi:hypothetical protein
VKLENEVDLDHNNKGGRMQEDMDGDGQYQDEFGAQDGEGDRQYN